MTGAMIMMFGGSGAGDAPEPLGATSSDLNPQDTYSCVGYPPSVCPANVTITTNRVYISVTGGDGVGPTFLWEWVSGDVFDVENPTGQNTTFSKYTHRLNSHSGVYKCTITRGAETVILNHTVEAVYEYETGM